MGGKPQLLARLGSRSLNPERRQTGGSRASDVPGMRRNQPTLVSRQGHLRRNELVNARAWFESPDLLRTDDLIEERQNPRVSGGRPKHTGLSVGQNRQPDVPLLQRLQSRSDVGKR